MAERCMFHTHPASLFSVTTTKSGPRPLACLRLITEHAFNDQSQICPLPQQNEYTISTSAVWSNTDQQNIQLQIQLRALIKAQTVENTVF